MAKITRALQKIFGESAGATGVAVFGSLKDGTTTYSYNAETIQNLPAFLEGWYGALIGLNSMAVEDRNALDYLYARQLAYLFQAGISEWDDSTVYYINSFVNFGGVIYKSLTDDNTNNTPPNVTHWVEIYVPATDTTTGLLSHLAQDIGGVKSFKANSTSFGATSLTAVKTFISGTIANGGTFDFVPGSSNFIGTIHVFAESTASPGNKTAAVYQVFNVDAGAAQSAQITGTAVTSSSGSTFTVSLAGTSTVRITNTSGASATYKISMFATLA